MRIKLDILLLIFLLINFHSLSFAGRKKHDRRYQEFVNVFKAAIPITEKNIESLKFGMQWQCWTIGPFGCNFGKYHGPKVRYEFYSEECESPKSLLPLSVGTLENIKSYKIINRKARRFEDKQWISKNGFISQGRKTELRITNEGYLVSQSKKCGNHDACGNRYSLCEAVDTSFEYQILK